MEEKVVLKYVPFPYKAPALYEIRLSRFAAMGEGSGGLPKEEDEWDDAFA